MSVLIKGMKMPKNCLTCKLKGNGSDSKYVWDCPFTGFEYTREEGETGRLDECPLVEVPAPHGDLIDRDALEADIFPEWNGLYVPDNAYSEKLICNAPTVIEAEEGDEHDT